MRNQTIYYTPTGTFESKIREETEEETEKRYNLYYELTQNKQEFNEGNGFCVELENNAILFIPNEVLKHTIIEFAVKEERKKNV